MGAKRRVGIMGGTFDPIHYGHLVIAEAAKSEYNLEKVVFIPNSIPPHKRFLNIEKAKDRFEMVKMAIGGNSDFGISSIELDRPGPSYTVDTLIQLTSENPDTEFYIIIGADAIAEILDWKRVDILMGLCSFIATTRPGIDKEQLDHEIMSLPENIRKNIFTIKIPGVAVSSTEIRERIKENKPIRYLLPEVVENYIYQKRLYR